MNISIKLLLTFSLFKSFSTFAQTKDPISVHIEIIGRGNIYDSLKNNSNNYFTRFEVINNEDTTLPITVWNCSWYSNWKPSTDSIRVGGWGCDGDYPETFRLLPKKTLVFYGSIYIKPTNKNKRIRMGFVNCSKEFIDNGFSFFDPRNPEGKVYWSEEIMIQDFYYAEMFIK